MERRQFLTLFGLGGVALAAIAVTMTPAQALTALSGPSPAPALPEIPQADVEKGEFAQYWRRRRRRRWWRRRSRGPTRRGDTEGARR